MSVPMTREEIVQVLQTKKNVLIDFTKKEDGSQRLLKATLDFNVIPEENHPKGDSKRKINEEVISVWDLEKKAWRSFRIDTLNKISWDE